MHRLINHFKYEEKFQKKKHRRNHIIRFLPNAKIYRIQLYLLARFNKCLGLSK